MYTAFLSMPSVELQPDATAEEISTSFAVASGSPSEVPDFWRLVGLNGTAKDTAVPAWQSIGRRFSNALSESDAIKYVVFPAMVGGLGSVALQMVEDGGSFVVKDPPSTSADAVQDDNTEGTSASGDETSQDDNTEGTSTSGDETSTITESISQTEIPPHDFVPSIEMGNGLEFSILVVSSVLLGAVVGFIGAVLSLDGPPEAANNKSKLAATALMFALFFPSVITVFRENAVSQAKLTTSEEVRELEKAVDEKSDQAANLEQTIQEVTKSDSNSQEELEQSLIDADKSLVINATSVESADAAINRIFERGETSADRDIKQHAIEALEDIQKNPEVQATVRSDAEDKVNDLNGDSEDTSDQVQD